MPISVKTFGSFGSCALEVFDYISKALVQETKDRREGAFSGRELV